jgi:hypothetical protein
MTRIDSMIIRSALAAALLVGGANLASAASTSGASNGTGSSQGSRGEPSGRSGEGLDRLAYVNRNTVDYCRQRGGRDGCAKRDSDAKAMVCYYTQPNFKGSHSCVKPGISSTKLIGRWNDNISSIRVVGNASTKLCTDRVFGGYCVTISSSRTNLDILDDEISSFRVN